MPDTHPDEWLTLDESITEDIGDDCGLQACFDEAGARVEVALKVYQLRNGYKLTRRQFGKIVGLTVDQITKIERANFVDPPNDVIESVCEKMNRWIESINSTSEPSLPSRLCAATTLKTNSV
jgi:hypothetical protein